MPEDEPEFTEVGRFEKNSQEVVIIRINSWKGRKYVDVRAWVEEGQKATHKGITLSIDQLPELMQILQGIREE